MKFFSRRQTLLERTQQWTSALGFVLATSGAAVGLGNIWMFPYMTGVNGGAAFILIYLVCILLMGVPVMMAETIVGRFGQANVIESMERMAKASGASKHWGLVGVLGGITLVLILSFYSVVSGWTIAYFFKTMMGTFDHANIDHVKAVWGDLMNSPKQLLLYHTLFMVMTMGVVALGIEKGLERASKIMMPALIVILMLLVGYALVTGDVVQSVNFLFKPDFSKVNAKTVLTAMGLAFFSLAVGAGCIATYASYLKKGEGVTGDIFKIVGIDTFVAVLAGLAIFPLVFQYGLTPEAGPGLVFQVLPMAFGQMPFGQFVGMAFFMLLLFAVWTSSISLAEPLVAMLNERYHQTRLQAVVTIGLSGWLLGIAVLLSFNVWSGVTIFGNNFFDIATGLPNKILLPLGGLLFAVFTGYVVKPALAQDALQLKSHFWFRVWKFLVCTVSPLAIVAVLWGAL
ncbi:MAG: sodium-dependent transporter [Gammaproteobacteria bacterium]